MFISAHILNISIHNMLLTKSIFLTQTVNIISIENQDTDNEQKRVHKNYFKFIYTERKSEECFKWQI